MNTISTKKLFELYLDTLDCCKLSLLSEADDIIEYELFEEFDIGVHSFLHHKNLEKLLKENYIDEEIKNLSIELREMYLLIDEDKHGADDVRNDKDWHAILKLSDLIKNKISKLE